MSKNLLDNQRRLVSTRHWPSWPIDFCEQMLGGAGQDAFYHRVRGPLSPMLRDRNIDDLHKLLAFARR